MDKNLDNDIMLQVLDSLNKQVGKRYVFGAEVKKDDSNPQSFDCSELVEWIYELLGRKIPDGAANQYEVSKPINEMQLEPFDLGFLLNPFNGKINHVVIWLGDANGNIVHAKGEAHGIIKESGLMWSKRNKDSFAGWRRFL